MRVGHHSCPHTKRKEMIRRARIEHAIEVCTTAEGITTPVLATCHIRQLNQVFESTFPCLSQLADSPEEEYNRDAFICSTSKGGNVHCAWNSHLHLAVDRPLPSVAPPLLQRLDETVRHFSLVGVAGRPSQKQVRTDG